MPGMNGPDARCGGLAEMKIMGFRAYCHERRVRSPPMNFTRLPLPRILALSACFAVSTVSAQNAEATGEVPPSLVPAELVPDTRA